MSLIGNSAASPSLLRNYKTEIRNAHIQLEKNKNSRMKIVVSGGVAGGASAAARACHLNKNAEIVLLQSDPDVSYASCGMPYLIGRKILDCKVMAIQRPQTLHDRLDLDVRVSTRVFAIDTVGKAFPASKEQIGKSYNKPITNFGHGRCPIQASNSRNQLLQSFFTS
jgi:hypothetical protein